MAHRTIVAVVSLLTLLSAQQAAAQTATDTGGSIAGKITDQTDQPLAGVAVVISSEAQMGTQRAATNEAGLFHVTALAPGVYAVSFSRPGFTTLLRSGVLVSLSATTTVNAALLVAGPQQTITVEGSPPLIDGRSSTTSVIFDREQLANLPAVRSMGALLAATPAMQMGRIDVGGSAAVITPAFAAYGPAGQVRPVVEGITVATLNGLGFPLNYGSFQEVSVATVGQSAESAALLTMQFVTKSGGNQPHASVYADGEHHAWQAFNIDAAQMSNAQAAGGSLAREANRLWRYHDLNGEASGFIRRDRLWWYGSIREQRLSTRVVTFPLPQDLRLRSYTGKGTYQLTQRQRVVVFAHLGRNDLPHRLDAFTVGTAINNPTSTAKQTGSGWIGKADWSLALGSFYVEARAGTFTAWRRETPNSVAPRYEDTLSLVVTGANRNWETALRRPQLFASATRSAGRHHLRGGFEINSQIARETWFAGYGGGSGVVHVLENTVPAEVVLFETPTQAESGSWWFSAYLNDAWRVHDRLSINLGARLDRFRLFFPAQTHPANPLNPIAQPFPAVDNLIAWYEPSLRLGLAYDLTGRGTTFLKLSAAHLPGVAGPEQASNANRNSTQWWRRHDWLDGNLDRLWQPGEEVQPASASRGGALDQIDPALKLNYYREGSAWLEREFPGRLGLRTGVAWRGERQQFIRQNLGRPSDAYRVATAIKDPGPDGLPGNGDDGPDIVASAFDPAFQPGGPGFRVANVANSDTSYWTWEITATRRQGGRWSLVASFAETWQRDQASGYFGQNVRGNALPLTPNDLIHTGRNGGHEFTMWSAKVFATYQAPWRLRITPVLRHQSGQAFGRTIAVSASAFGTNRVLAEAIGARRMDNLTLVDLRVEKSLRLTHGTASAFLDVFNLFNANPEQMISWRSGPTFQQPLTIVPPRIARIGIRIEW